MLPTYRTVLCCHGLGAHSQQVLAHGFGLAQRYAAQVVVVHATEPPSPQAQAMLETYLPSGTLEELHADTRQKIRELIDEHIRQIPEGLGARYLREVRVVEGRSAETLLRIAREIGADLIVMGAHRHTTVGELLVGSTAHGLIQRSPVPVLMVRVAP